MYPTFSNLKSQLTYHRLALPLQTLVNLSQVECILALARLKVDLLQKVLNNADNLGYRLLIGIVIRGIFENSLKQQGITSKAGRWFRQVAIQLQLSRFGSPFCFL